MILWAYRLWENTQTKSLVLSTNILEGKKKKKERKGNLYIQRNLERHINRLQYTDLISKLILINHNF